MTSRRASSGDIGSSSSEHASTKKMRTAGDLIDIGRPIDDEATARRKLEEVGFDPDKLSEVKPFGREGSLATADELATIGHGGVWFHSINPMIFFCYHGDLSMCRYLCANGAANDVTRSPRSEYGTACWTPMFAAVRKGHLETCQWLLEHGAAKHVGKRNRFYDSPLRWVIARDDVSSDDDMCASDGITRDVNTRLFHWLILNGALNSVTSGHVDAATVRRDLSPEVGDVDARPKLLSWAQDIVQAHETFCATFLMGTISPPDFTTPSLLRALTTRLRSENAGRKIMESIPSNLHQSLWNDLFPKQSPLYCFNGLPGIMELVAAFVGVERGRRLRNAREFAEMLLSIMSEDEDTEVSSSNGDEGNDSSSSSDDDSDAVSSGDDEQ